MLFEKDGYKTFGEKNVGCCCKFVTSQALMWNIFIGGGGGGGEQREVLEIHKNALFKVLWHFREGWYKK